MEAVGTNVLVGVHVGQGVLVRLAVAVLVGRAVGDEVWVAVALAVRVGVAVPVAVLVELAVGDALGVKVCDGVRLGKGEGGTTAPPDVVGSPCAVPAELAVGEAGKADVGGRRLRFWTMAMIEDAIDGEGSPSIACVPATNPQNATTNTIGMTSRPIKIVRLNPPRRSPAYPTGRLGAGPAGFLRSIRLPPGFLRILILTYFSRGRHSRLVPNLPPSRNSDCGDAIQIARGGRAMNMSGQGRRIAHSQRIVVEGYSRYKR